MKTPQRPLIVEYISLLLMLTLTVVSVANKDISVFYILYLFWWDEFLKSFFDFLRRLFKKNQIANLEAYSKIVRTRFFFLFVYIVFIIVIFGLVINWEEDDIVLNNFNVVFFKNSFFNFTLLSFLLREIYLFRNDYGSIMVHHILSKGIITLHISLILGIIMWFFVTKQFGLTGLYPTLISIVPFLLLKLYFETKEIQYNNLQRKQSSI